PVSSKATSWTAATVILALVILAASWFLAISPKLEEAVEVAASTEEVRAHNDLIQLQNLRLAADFARLDEYRVEIDAVKVKLPPVSGLAELTRTFEKYAEDNELTVIAVAPSTPVYVPSTTVPKPVAPPVPEGTEGT